MESSDELVIERLARMNGIRTIRISESLRRHRKSLDEAMPKVFTVRCGTIHPSPLACQVAATALYTAIESETKAPLAPGEYDHEVVRIAEWSRAWSASEIRGIHAARQGRFTEVRDLLSKTVEQNPNDYDTRSRLALCSHSLGQIDDAKQIEIIRAKPDDLFSNLRLFGCVERF